MKNNRLYHYCEVDARVTQELMRDLFPKLSWWRRLWFRIRFGNRWMMKPRENETALQFGTRWHQHLEQYYKTNKPGARPYGSSFKDD